MKLLNSGYTLFETVDLSSTNEVAMTISAAGTHLALASGAMHLLSAFVSAIVAAGSTVTFRLYAGTEAIPTGYKLVEKTLAAGSVAALKSAVLDIAIPVIQDTGTARLTVTLQSDNDADSSVSGVIYLADLNVGGSNNRVDVGTVLGSAPLDGDGVATAVLQTPANKLVTDAAGRVAVRGGRQ
jgi:hypothetical protein